MTPGSDDSTLLDDLRRQRDEAASAFADMTIQRDRAEGWATEHNARADAAEAQVAALRQQLAGLRVVLRDESGVCRLCGATGLLELRPLELPDGKGGWTYESGLRCVDLAGCKKRRQEQEAPE